MALHKPGDPGCQLFRGGGCFPGGFCALFCGLLRPLLVLPSKPLFLPVPGKIVLEKLRVLLCGGVEMIIRRRFLIPGLGPAGRPCRMLPDFALYKPGAMPQDNLPALRIGPFCLGGFCFASFSRAASRFSPRFSMRSLDAAACSCWLFCRNFDFGTLCPEVPAAPGSCSEPAPKAEPSGSAAPFPGSVCVWDSGRGLFGFRFILHILRSGG